PARVAARVYASLATGIFELLWIAGSGPDAVDGCIELTPAARTAFDRAAAHGRGVVVATAHTGNWDLAACAAARWQARRGGPPLHVVTKRLSWRALDRYWQELRAHRGVVLLEARGAAKQVGAALAREAPVALLVDQAPERASGVVALP